MAWTGTTNRKGRFASPWLDADRFVYTYCCSENPNPIKISVTKKKRNKALRRVYNPLTYRNVDLNR